MPVALVLLRVALALAAPRFDDDLGLGDHLMLDDHLTPDDDHLAMARGRPWLGHCALRAPMAHDNPHAHRDVGLWVRRLDHNEDADVRGIRDAVAVDPMRAARADVRGARVAGA